MNEQEFRYEVITFDLPSGQAKMDGEVQRRFNTGWKPTTNGPCLVVLTEKHTDAKGLEKSTYRATWIFAKEKLHGH